jgi:AraC-like DNA-binding protein
VLFTQAKNRMQGYFSKRIKHQVQIYLSSFAFREINLSEYLSEKLGYNYTYLSYKFSFEQRITIEKYFQRVRIKEAKKMLRNNAGLAKIVLTLGFSSRPHLSAQFKKVTGISPTEYKRR